MRTKSSNRCYIEQGWSIRPWLEKKVFEIVSKNSRLKPKGDYWLEESWKVGWRLRFQPLAIIHQKLLEYGPANRCRHPRQQAKCRDFFLGIWKKPRIADKWSRLSTECWLSSSGFPVKEGLKDDVTPRITAEALGNVNKPVVCTRLSCTYEASKKKPVS